MAAMRIQTFYNTKSDEVFYLLFNAWANGDETSESDAGIMLGEDGDVKVVGRRW